jgi:2-succinyl-5-enolpyruvyl-6-hydroxy-3-cyclohexene-1-carboxylate synthase
MSLGDLNFACAWGLVDELAAAGVDRVCLSPGSRSTPLALAFSRHPGIDVQMHLDERSGSFVALGIAKATGRPVAVATTSGTAVAELLPAVVEASQSRTPLIVLTADRPPDLRGTGANQTIVQPGIFGEYARASIEMPLPATEGQDLWWRQAAREALLALAGDPPGPVHVNCPFEEPLAPEGIVPATSLDQTSERFELPSRGEAELDPHERERLAETVSGARGVVVIGGWPGDVSGEATFWSEVLHWPVIAEPTSSARRPPWALQAGQALLGDDSWIGSHRAEVVIQFGATPTSRATQGFVASASQLIVADRWHLDPDPQRQASWRLAVDPEALRHALSDSPVVQGGEGIALVGSHTDEQVRGLWGKRIDPAPSNWQREWLSADQAARQALDHFLDGVGEPFEPRIARDVSALISDGGTLFVGNSTPVRDLDLAMAPRDGLRVLANRGASGIDGLVSTAIGVASGNAGPTTALIGDLSLLHDLGALFWNADRGVSLTCVVLDNGGGQLFSLLPHLDLPEREQLFVTPHGLDIAAACEAAGISHMRVEAAAELAPALESATGEGISMVTAAIDPERDRQNRDRLRKAVGRSLGG